MTPRQALNKAFLKVKPHRDEIELFKTNLIALLDQIREAESEEFHKDIVSHFLSATYYQSAHYINTKGRNDLVIHHGPNAASPVGVIIEAKKPTNRAEMLRPDHLNARALQELVLYYLRERITHRNLEIRQLVATNVHEWFVFDAQVFEGAFAQNKTLVRQFMDFEEKRLADVRTDFFYKEIAEPAIAAALDTKEGLPHAYFDLRQYERPLRNASRADDHTLIPLYKLLSPPHLLKLPFANDSNSLNRAFYAELLHIIGLTETKEAGKKIIRRKAAADRNPGSLLENTIVQLDALGKIDRLDNPRQYGNTPDERLFSVGLELCITWVNRILFLKLLEAQLVGYHQGNRGTYAFLNSDKIRNFDDLNALFFQVLARLPADRSEELRRAFGEVPYLNSSLFELSDIEDRTIVISNLRDERTLPILAQTVLKDRQGRRRSGQLATLDYLFAFLDAYDFSSEGAEAVQEDNKTLINASVLGLIFEKINGYRDGSFFTPGFVTMYMCRETLRRAVLQKFNEGSRVPYLSLDDVYDAIGRDFTKAGANARINSLKICDPAVGSGHFLVSALNELIAIKSELKILLDRAGRTLRDYHVEVVNDELTVTDDDGKLFDYHPDNPESQRVQEALFHEKQTLIENCLFGVDLNPNSVKICRLRLWIELLKNAYYKMPAANSSPVCYLDSDEVRPEFRLETVRMLETLPNIDINIKRGNSLTSRFGLDADLKPALQKGRFSIDAYKAAVQTYRHARGKEQKREMERLIATIKGDFRTEISNNDPKLKRRARLSGELYNLVNQSQLFSPRRAEQKVRKQKQDKLEREITKLTADIDEIKSNRIYENAFEWRFEFPEVLNDDGDFVGFDVILGNPPYIRQEEFSALKPYLQEHFATYSGTADLYVFFVEKGFQLLTKLGYFCYIMPNKWMQTGYGKPLRSFFLDKKLLAITDFGDLQVFDGATTYPCIIEVKNDAAGEELQTCVVETLDFGNNLGKYVLAHQEPYATKYLTDETWILASPQDQALLEKLKNNCVTLSDYVGGEAYYGIKTGLTEAFIIDEDKKQILLAQQPNSEFIIKPVLQGRDIKPYQTPNVSKYLLFIPWHFPLNDDPQISGASEKADSAFNKNYPAIYEHLLSFRQKLQKRNKAETGVRYEWYAMQRWGSDYWQEFEKPKIMYQVMQVKPCFIYDDQGLYCNNSMWIIPKDDKVLVAILNSKMGWWLIGKYCTAIQNGYQLIWKYFGQIPIPPATPGQAAAVEEKVNQILALKKANPLADTTALEADIDRLVYALYGLTEEEIRLMEGEI